MRRLLHFKAYLTSCFFVENPILCYSIYYQDKIGQRTSTCFLSSGVWRGWKRKKAKIVKAWKGKRMLPRYRIWNCAGEIKLHVAVVQSLSCFQLSVTPWTTARQATLSFTDSWSLLRLMSIESVMPSNHLILCCPFLLLPRIRVFSSESVLHIRWPKYWSFSPSISPSNEYSGIISFRMDRLDLLAVQGTLKSLL